MGRCLQALCWALLLLPLSACGGGGTVPPQIAEFAAEPSTVAPGGTVVLHWQVDQLDGGRLRLESLADGEVEPAQLGEVTTQTSTAVVVEATTTYRLVAASSGGTASKETRVSVVAPPPEPPQIDYFRKAESDGVVELEWQVSAAERVTIEPLGTEVELQGSLAVDPCATTEYTLHSSNAGGTASSSLTVEVDSSDCLLFLIAGQSNASGGGLEEGGQFPVEGLTEEPSEGVMMLTPAGEWVVASEPTHLTDDYEHSFLLRFGKEVRADTGKRVFLVPSAVGGSALTAWEPNDDNFENAVSRAEFARSALGIPVSAVIWYQGESETSYERERDDFVAKTRAVFENLRDELGDPEVIFVQLSKRLWSEGLPEEMTEPDDNIPGHNLSYQVIRERQRLMEAGAYSSETGAPAPSTLDESYYHMAVSHDLPMSDAKHLSAEGQRYLGSRIARLYLDCVLVECSRPPGPRLTSVTLDPGRTTVLVELSKEVVEPPDFADYLDYFSVFVDGNEQPGMSVSLSPDRSVIELEFPTAFPLGSLVEVRYMPPAETGLYTWSEHVVESRVDGLDLPLPAFGMPVEPLEDHYPGLRIE